MAIALHQVAAAVYLLAGVAAALGLALAAPRILRASAAVLATGSVVHLASFGVLHGSDPPPLTNLAAATSFMALVGTIAFLALMRSARLAGLVVLVAPLAFLGVFVAALRLPEAAPSSFGGSGSWPHAHVLLASAGLSLLGLAGVAGVLYLAEHRRLKAKRTIGRIPLPSLEALDRVNAAALAVGFPLLTLGVVTGVNWVQAVSGRYWTGSAHQTWSIVAWCVYAVLAGSRFWSHHGAHRAAVSAIGAFLFLCFAVIGVEILA